MTAIESEFEPRVSVLPKDYGIFETKVLEDLMRLFNSTGKRCPLAIRHWHTQKPCRTNKRTRLVKVCLHYSAYFGSLGP